MAEKAHCDVLCLDVPVAEALRLGRLDARKSAEIATAARSFADPTRVQIAHALAGADELCVCDLAWIVERSQALVSHHLRSLREAGVVESRRNGKMVMYKLTDRGARMLAAATADGAAA